MGTVKGLVDLVTQLIGSVQDRKFAAELREIQGMIGAIQSEHAELHEQRIALMTENAELKNTIVILKEEIAALKAQKELSSSPGVDVSKKLSAEAESILLFLTKHTEAFAEQISSGISLELVKTEYWIEVLSEKDMITFSIAMNQPSYYYLAQGGREYLIRNQLI